MRATQRLYLTEDDRIVTEGHHDGRSLFAKAGDEIPDHIAMKYGLLETKKAIEQVENKMIAPPPNKGSGVRVIKAKEKPKEIKEEEING